MRLLLTEGDKLADSISKEMRKREANTEINTGGVNPKNGQD